MIEAALAAPSEPQTMPNKENKGNQQNIQQLRIPMPTNSQRASEAGFNFSSQVEHFKVTNAANRGAVQKGSHWPGAPSMAKAAANAKQETNVMKRARSFSNNRAFGQGVA